MAENTEHENRLNREVQHYRSMIDKIEIVNGNIFVIGDEERKRVPTIPQREELIRAAHELEGHFGTARVRTKLKENFLWHGMDKDISEVIGACTLCQRYKNGVKRKKDSGTLCSYSPFEKIVIDITGPLRQSKNGSKYILLIIDHFSKYLRLIPMKQTRSIDVARALIVHWISIFGIPRSIHSDRGTNFNSSIMEEVYRYFGILKTKTTPYHPEGDGVVERAIRTVKPLLSIRCEEFGRD